MQPVEMEAEHLQTRRDVYNFMEAEDATSVSNNRVQSEHMLYALEDAIGMARSIASVVESSETIPIDTSLGRRLSKTVSAQIDIPAYDQSAMDGYALAGHVSNGTYTLRKGEATHSSPLQSGQAQIVSIGSKVPVGADRVILERHAQATNGEIVATKDVGQGASIRLQGEDTRSGEQLFVKGTRLDVRKLSVLASQKLQCVDVIVQPRIAFFSTVPRQIRLREDVDASLDFDTNRMFIRASVEHAGAVFVDGGRCHDTPGDIAGVISFLSEKSDMIVFCGGTSPAQRELTSNGLLKAGVELVDMNIAMKPGKPVTIGRSRNTAILRLPDVPFASFVLWHCLGRSMLNEMLGLKADVLFGYQLASLNCLKRKPGKAEFTPVRRNAVAGLGNLEFFSGGGTSRIVPLAQADGLAYIDAARGDVQVGENVTFLPFGESDDYEVGYG